MNINSLIALIDAEISRLQKAKALLGGSHAGRALTFGGGNRPTAKKARSVPKPEPGSQPRRKRDGQNKRS